MSTQKIITRKGVNKTAIIVGASLAGLMAAKAISPYYSEVIILDKDKLEDKPIAHKGVSQGHHAHSILKAGEEALEELFPGVREELLNTGAHYVDFGNEIGWKHHGKWKASLSKPYYVLMQSRVFLEWSIRKRLLQSEGITLYQEAKVADVVFNELNEVSEVCIQSIDGKAETFDCDLLIDASGAANNIFKWFKKTDCELPEISKVNINLAYSSRNYKCPERFSPQYKAFLIYFGNSQPTHTGVMFSTEKKEVTVSLGGYQNNPPKDDDSFLSYAQQLDSPEIYSVIKDLEPAGSIKHYKFPEQNRKHFEKLKNAPNNLIFIGDALCRFDPVYGQGITVAALEAIALKQLLSSKKKHSNLAHSFHKKASKIVSVPWFLTSVEGFRLEHTTGKKPLPIGMKLIHWYLGNLFDVTSKSQKAYKTFLDVIHLKKKPTILFSPSIVFKVLGQSLQKKALNKSLVGRLN